MDELVLDNTIRMKIDHPWQGDNIPEGVAVEAVDVIDRELGVKLAPLEVNQRLKIMQA